MNIRVKYSIDLIILQRFGLIKKEMAMFLDKNTYGVCAVFDPRVANFKLMGTMGGSSLESVWEKTIMQPL